jgi:hypothetical protein
VIGSDKGEVNGRRRQTAPGPYLRDGLGVGGWSADPVQVIAFTIATLSQLSLLFGFI